MFDCMEALGLASRPLFDVSGQGSCMLGKATPYFSGLDPFAWAGSSSIQCEYPVPSRPSGCKRTAVRVNVCPHLSSGFVITELSPQEESDSSGFYVPILTLQFVCLCS